MKITQTHLLKKPFLTVFWLMHRFDRYLDVFLGICVGRDTCPIRFDNESIMTELAQLIESDVQKQQEYAKLVNSQEKKPEIEFFQALKKTSIDLMPHAQDNRPSQNLDRNVPEKQLITKRSTKKKTMGNFSISREKERDLSDCVTLQAAALKDPHAAIEMARRLKNMGFPAYTASINLPKKGLWHRVRVGTFTSVEQARQMKNRLQKNNINSIIVPFDQGDFNFANAKDRIAYPES
ncbi:MAG: hypothetical protein OMM_00699 [Candidatus Magnetoglobus multicellularis str. Araruama]|uniref:SPOR domain-containing protein n=1 Tax=Candidatus Magnetoglobus multicellularis str. Araruama TaxID=890399 RepID=A0A1V1PGE9_9BACT|nr:MAG: hypothetical protein OMM_00699 [Candidatus Magnetoglobus multicellularis str. Araruama]